MAVLWALIIACTDAEPVDSADEPEVELTTSWSVPTTLDFGVQALDVAVEELLTIVNDGESDVLMSDFSATTGVGVEIGNPPFPTLASGQSVDIPVTWTPTTPGLMNAELELKLGNWDGQTPVSVAVSGSAQGGAITLSSTAYDYGDIPVGCEGSFTLTLSNSGNADMQLDSVLVGGDKVFVLAPVETLPLTLSPFQSTEISVTYQPDEREQNSGSIEIETDLGPTYVTLSGEGKVDSDNTLNWTVGERSKSTILVHANECIIDGPYGDAPYGYAQQFEDSIEAFYQALLDNGTDFRIAWIWNVSGEGTGSVDYIDNSYTAAEAAALTIEMIEDGSVAGDNDRSYTTLLAAIDQNEDWLFEDETWEDSQLNLMAFNRDQEQSGGSSTTYVAQAQAYKDDTDKVVFHALAGPPPNGCGTAESFILFKNAVDSTGGTFVSICETDWTENMETLVAASVVGAEYYPLTGTPLVSSIIVSINSIKQTSGWEYDSGINAVKFDEDARPEEGAKVEVYYLKSGSCG